MSKRIVMIWLFLLFGGIAAFFWYNEWVYSLPTPVPQHYAVVNPGQEITIARQLNAGSSKPLFLHFFNPDCPCSRFNISHFKLLVKQYNNKANFAIVVMSKKNYAVRGIQERFELNTPVLFDTAIAVACGVYSTPQAVIIGADYKLYYRGNYNRSRYCADEKTSYAKIALEGLLHNDHTMIFNQFALTAYGCKLPNCNK
jgi:hypothetical protein